MTTATSKRSTTAAVPYWQLLTVGFATLIFGIAVLVRPDATLRLLGLVVGIWLIGVGVLRLVGVFNRGAGLGQQVVDGALGLILVVVGVTVLNNTRTGTMDLSVIIGLAWVLSGFAELLLGLMARGRAKVALFALAAASIVVGLLFLAWSNPSLHTLVLLTGITSLILGTAEIAVALQSRHAGPSAAPTSKR